MTTTSIHERFSRLITCIVFTAPFFVACENKSANMLAQLGSQKAPIIFKISKELNIELVDIPISLKPFKMGWEDSSKSDVAQAHSVLLTKSFYMAKFETTQAQWLAVMGGSNPSAFSITGGKSSKDDLSRPVERISWNQVQDFMKRLNALPEKPQGLIFRLPTEAEWEYACRAGSSTIFSFGDNTSELGNYAWYKDNSGGTTHGITDLKNPNAFGLYNMHGNVVEFAQDWWEPYNKDIPSLKDPYFSTGKGPVIRGGGWDNYAKTCACANRAYTTPDNPGFDVLMGFRIVLGSPI